jgi:hypothetical protein
MLRDIWIGALCACASVCLTDAMAQPAPAARQPAAAPAARALPQRAMAISPAARSLFQAARNRPAALALRAQLAGPNLRANAPRVNFAAIDRSRVPVLLTARAELIPNWRVYAFADRYTASSRKPGTVYEINGTRLPTLAPAQAPRNAMRLRAFAAPGAPPPQAGQDALENVRIDHTASGIDVTFTRFGHVYNISIDCGGPAEAETETAPAAPGLRARALARTANADCSDAAALAFAQQMEVVGGGAQ